MKKILGLFAICLSFGAFAGNNDIYITQTGTGLTLTIDQIGASNTVGTSSSRVTLSGTSMTLDIDQIGDSNSFLASILQGNSSSWDWLVTGDSNTGTFTVGGTGNLPRVVANLNNCHLEVPTHSIDDIVSLKKSWSIFVNFLAN